VRSRLSRCADDINSWRKSRRLQLNAKKLRPSGLDPDLSWRRSPTQTVHSKSTRLRFSRLLSFVISAFIWTLKLTELSMKYHVAKVAAICYYHLRRLCQIGQRVGQEVTTRLVLAMVISRLDYCNAALSGLPQATVAPLQRVQNSTARLIFKLSSRETRLLQLHWFPVRWRVQFKRCCIMHSVFYLRDVSGVSD